MTTPTKKKQRQQISTPKPASTPTSKASQTSNQHLLQQIGTKWRPDLMGDDGMPLWGTSACDITSDTPVLDLLERLVAARQRFSKRYLETQGQKLAEGTLSLLGVFGGLSYGIAAFFGGMTIDTLLGPDKQADQQPEATAGSAGLATDVVNSSPLATPGTQALGKMMPVVGVYSAIADADAEARLVYDDYADELAAILRDAHKLGVHVPEGSSDEELFDALVHALREEPSFQELSRADQNAKWLELESAFHQARMMSLGADTPTTGATDPRDHNVCVPEK
jgi:hypothetical protein